MPESAPRDRPPYVALALAAAAVVIYLASELYLLSGGLGFPLDDSWIHLQFARQVAAGEGLAYNPGGEPVPGSTAPLWTALLALGFLLPAGAAVAWAKLLGCAFFLGTVHASDRLAAALGLARGLRRLVAVLVAASHWLVWSALSGMEIALFTWLSLWGLILHLRERRPPVSLTVFALAALARPEGYLLLALAIGDRLLRYDGSSRPPRITVALTDRELWLGGVLPAAVILLPTLVFYRVAGDSFLPTTFAVKAGPPADLLPSGSYLRAVMDVLFRSQPVMLLLAGAGVLRLAVPGAPERRRPVPRSGLLVAVWPLGLALAYSLLAPPAGPVVVGNFGRYYFPVLPVVVVLGALSLEGCARRVPPKVLLGRWAIPLRAILVALVLAPQLWGLYRGPVRYVQTLANVEDSDVAAARWLRARLAPSALLAVQDIGALKYFLPNPIVDLTGIVNPDILPYLKAENPEVYWERRLLSYLEARRPDYLIVFPKNYPMLARSPRFAKVRGFRVENNVTMAGDELVIFSTPWNRFPLAEPAG